MKTCAHCGRILQAVQGRVAPHISCALEIGKERARARMSAPAAKFPIASLDPGAETTPAPLKPELGWRTFLWGKR